MNLFTVGGGGAVLGRAVASRIVRTEKAAKLVAVAGTGVVAGVLVAGFGIFEAH
jgi:uncharacterized membrane protein YcjF (UPF0283 family)